MWSNFKEKWILRINSGTESNSSSEVIRVQENKLHTISLFGVSLFHLFSLFCWFELEYKQKSGN